MACLDRRMVRLLTYSLTYHVFAMVVLRCLPCHFRLPECSSPVVLSNCRGFPLTSLSYSQQPAFDAGSTCPACKMLPGYSYLVAAPCVI